MKTLLFLIFLSLGSYVSIAAGQDSAANADFAWFNQLGFPDVKGSPYVRVATGWWSQSGEDPPRNKFVPAFLLETNGDSFTVFTLDLFQRQFTNTAHGAAPHKRVGFETLDLREAAKSELTRLRQPPGKDDHWRRFGERLTERGEIFTLAWGCWRNGLEPEALDLYEQATKMSPQRSSGHLESSFREGLEKDLGYAMIWRAIVSFGEPSISRRELLYQLEAIPANYPHSEYCERARQTAAVLKRMIAEDEAHAKAGTIELDTLSTNDQVRELIFRLRDQNGHQFSQPGSCDIFEDWHGKTNTPAHRLLRLSYVAVPQLIAALDSDTLTRSVGFWRDFTFSHNVLTVGDCCEAILQRITGKSFFVPTTTFSYMTKDGKASAVRRTAEAWWVEFQKKGEKQMLMDTVATGGNDAPAQAEILSQKYPDVSTESLVQGARSTTNSWIRSRLIEQIAKLDRATGRDFLKAELEHGPTLQSRVAAAFGLLPSQKQRATEAMIQEWKNLPSIQNGDDSGWESLVDFLGSCDSVDAVNALSDNIGRRSPEVKLKVIEALGEKERWNFNSTFGPVSAETLAVMEKSLIAALEDTEERMGLSGSRNGKNYSDPRICDIAGLFLAERWPERYKFDISAPLKTRDRQRIECANTWRRTNFLEPFPVTEDKSVHVLRNEATKVQSIVWSTDSMQPSKAFDSRLSEFKGKLLDSEKLVRFLANFAGHPESGASGLDLKVIKDDDLTGVRIHAKLLPLNSSAEKSGWNCNERVILGRETLQSSSGTGIVEAYSDMKEWDDFKDAVNRALAGEAETPFEISVRLSARTD